MQHHTVRLFSLLFMLLVSTALICSTWTFSAAVEGSKLPRITTTSMDYTPLFMHLAFTSVPTEMVVSFHTNDYDEKILGKPFVKYGKEDTLKIGAKVSWIGAVITQYGDVKHTGYDFNILMKDLEYQTKYYYQVGFLGSNVTSGVYNFHTRTDPRSIDSFETTVVMYGDQGTTNSKYAIAQVENFIHSFYNDKSAKNMFIYHLGDISYADDWPGILYQVIWARYLDMMSNIMPFVSYMTLPGNHEKGPKIPPYHSYEEGFVAYNHRFFMPLRNDSRFGHNMWHSFQHGPITFVSIDTETNFPHNFYPEYDFKGDQMKWLDETLSKIDRKVTPWVIVLGHRPIYTSKHGFSNAEGIPEGQAIIVQDAFEEILYKYHVDIATFGHVHSYQRTFPTYKLQVETKTNYHNLRYPIHIINGAGGCLEGITIFMHKYSPWSAKIFNEDEAYGILRTSYNPTTRVHKITFNLHAAKTNEIVDTVTITKDAY